MGDSKSGGGARKIGRGMRKPSRQRYVAEQRWIKNKKRRMVKQAKLEAKQKAKKIRRKQD